MECCELVQDELFFLHCQQLCRVFGFRRPEIEGLYFQPITKESRTCFQKALPSHNMTPIWQQPSPKKTSASKVVAFARIAFGVFVGQLRTLGFHNGAADVVFRGDQLDVVLILSNNWRLTALKSCLAQNMSTSNHTPVRKPTKPYMLLF
jgi:hypothetical protein